MSYYTTVKNGEFSTFFIAIVSVVCVAFCGDALNNFYRYLTELSVYAKNIVYFCTRKRFDLLGDGVDLCQRPPLYKKNDMKATEFTLDLVRMFLDENNPDGIYTDVEFVGYFDDNPVYEAIFDDMSGACIGYPFYILVTPDGVRFSDDEEGAKITSGRK